MELVMNLPNENEKYIIPVINEKPNVSKGKTVVFIRCGLAVYLTLGILFLLMIINRPKVENNPIETPFVIQEEQPRIIISANENKNEETITKEESWNNLHLPLEFEYWLTIPYHTWKNRPDYEQLKQQAIKWTQLTPISAYTITIPSREFGFTDDIEEIWLLEEDGEYRLNLKFAYILKEDIEYSIAVTLHRLINPIFGGWDTAQPNMFFMEIFEDLYFIPDPDDPNEPMYAWHTDWGMDAAVEIWSFPLFRFKDMFEMELWETIEKPDELPIKYDTWNYMDGSQYNRNTIDTRNAEDEDLFLIGFFGFPKNSQIRVSVEPHENLVSDVINITAPIVYSAIIDIVGGENVTVEVEATMKLQFTPNFDIDSEQKFLISHFELVF
jgi:hypothetical protein